MTPRTFCGRLVGARLARDEGGAVHLNDCVGSIVGKPRSHRGNVTVSKSYVLFDERKRGVL